MIKTRTTRDAKKTARKLVSEGHALTACVLLPSGDTLYYHREGVRVRTELAPGWAFESVNCPVVVSHRVVARF